jgi:enoyl-CoA hydratase
MNQFVTVSFPSPGVVTLTIDRPPVNAACTELYDELRPLFRHWGRDAGTRAIILTAAGTRAFIGGHDVHDIHGLTYESSMENFAKTQATFNSIYDCPVPVICAINGPALGAGIAVIGVCDIRIASTTATFALPEVELGTLGGPKHLMRLAGQGVTRLLMYTGRRIGAAEALRTGLVDQVHEPDQVLAAAEGIAAEIADMSPKVVRLAKTVMNQVENMSLKEGYELETRMIARTREPDFADESAEASLAWLEKRKPRFAVSWSQDAADRRIHKA